MCGHVGAAGLLNQKDEDAFNFMLELDTFRGPHSTGIFAVGKYSEEDLLVKALGTPWGDIVNDPNYRKLFTGYKRLLMGHNRWATLGAKTKENAHPFEWGHVVGAHNGTLKRTHRHMLDEHKEFEVDSDNIFYHLSVNGPSDTISKLHGAYALVWYDRDEKNINFIRNDERTLYYCYSESNSSVYWASEDWILKVALDHYSIKHGDVKKFEVGVHYRLNLTKSPTFGSLDKFRVKELKMFELPPVNKSVRRTSFTPANQNNWTKKSGSGILTPPHDPLVGKKSYTFTDYCNLVGDRVTFRVVSSVGHGNNQYLRGLTRSGLEVRLHNSPYFAEFNLWRTSGTIVEAKIIAAKNTSGGYLKASWKGAKKESLSVDDTRGAALPVKVDNPKKEHPLKKAVGNVFKLRHKDTDDYGNYQDSYEGSEEISDGVTLVVDGDRMSKSKFMLYVKDGCCMCADPIDLAESHEIMWASSYDHTPVCKSCQDSALTILPSADPIIDVNIVH